MKNKFDKFAKCKTLCRIFGERLRELETLEPPRTASRFRQSGATSRRAKSRKWRPTCGFELLQFESKVFEHVWKRFRCWQIWCVNAAWHLLQDPAPSFPDDYIQRTPKAIVTAEVPQIKEERLMQIVWRTSSLIQKSLRRRVSTCFCNCFWFLKPLRIAWHPTSFDGQFGVFLECRLQPQDPLPVPVTPVTPVSRSRKPTPQKPTPEVGQSAKEIIRTRSQNSGLCEAIFMISY